MGRPLELGGDLDDNAIISFGAQLAELTSMHSWGTFEQVVNAYLTAIAVQGLDSEEPKDILRAKRDAVREVFGNVRGIIQRAQELQADQADQAGQGGASQEQLRYLGESGRVAEDE